MNPSHRFIFSAVALLAVVSIPAAEAVAQTVRVRTQTLGKGTQFRRSDFSVEARRLLSQRLSLWAWDAAPGFLGTVDVRVSARYAHDFGVAAEDRGNPWVESERSRFLLDLTEIRWRPINEIEVTAGRHWVTSALGVRDIDGVSLDWNPRLGKDLRGRLGAFAGFEVESGWATVNPDVWDVQGLPIREDGNSPGGRRYGVSAGIALHEARLEVAWQRRDGVGADGETYLGSERLGAGLSGEVARGVAVSAAASYHLVLDDVDRADFNVAWREPWAGTVLSGGLEHRQPWFDSSSIFNVFGARPFEGAYLTYQVPVVSLQTSFEARGWARAYDGNLDLGDFGAGEQDERMIGAGVGHTTRFRAFGRRWTWRTYGSWQTSEDRSQGGTQWLADTRFEFAAIRDLILLETRFLGLHARPGVSSRYGQGGALTAVVGMKVPTSFGTFRLAVEGQDSSYFGGNTNAYASFGSELWL